MRRGLCLRTAAIFILIAAGCADDDSGESAVAAPTIASTAVPTVAATPTTPPPTTAMPSTVAVTTVAPTTVAVTAPPTTEPEIPRWTETSVEGCVCSDGSPLKIFERVADPTKVVLYFEGGGACFSAATCDPKSGFYRVNAKGFTTISLEQLGAGGGYLDAGNPKNPLRSDSWVYVPYCTGDVHGGNTTHDYGGGIVIEHRGYANALKALDYLVAQYPDAQQVVVTGESAGAVPTALFGALVADRLPNADVVTFGDSSGGYGDTNNPVIGTNWGFPDNVPDWPELDGLTVDQWSFPERNIYAGQHAPRVRFGRFDYASDKVQAAYAAAAGAPADQLVTVIDGTEKQIEDAGVQVASYVASGNSHVIVTSPLFYSLRVNAVSLVDWVTALINDSEPPADVHA